jgi:hypothetical protein
LIAVETARRRPDRSLQKMSHDQRFSAKIISLTTPSAFQTHRTLQAEEKLVHDVQSVGIDLAIRNVRRIFARLVVI